tara:strand:+ start:114 stop:578 length:465 start_codon:yes stop_codon:yes gene_type:complete
MSLYNKVIKKLIENNVTVATAESCTGGLLAHTFTKNSGVSKIYKTGIICYSNSSKIKNLGISSLIINKFGAVSAEVAKYMVNKLQKKEKSSLCISTTGIAGPNGATRKKPIGLVYIGIKYNSKTYIFKKIFIGSRLQIQKNTVKFIFITLKKLI